MGSLKQTIFFDFCLLDYDFEPSSESLHVLLKVDSSVMVETYKMDCSKLVKDSTHSFNDLKQADFFDSVKDFEKSNLENLVGRFGRLACSNPYKSHTCVESFHFESPHQVSSKSVKNCQSYARFSLLGR